MSWKPMLPEGISPAQRIDCLARHCNSVLRAANSLGEMTKDWAFFTIGCIYTYGGLDVNLIAEYSQTHEDRDCCVMTLLAERPLFIGVCPPGWPDKTRRLDHELCAAPLEYWDELKGRLGEISMVDRRKGRFARTLVQELEIVDYLAVRNAIVPTPKPPTLTITTFGIDGTHHHVAFAPQTAGPYDAARVIRLPIREETRAVGQAILAGDPFPLVATLTPAPAAPADVAKKVQEAKEKS